MDTAQVAAKLGTTPRILRAFLRSSQSTFLAVGSGSRYEFTETDLPMLQRRFVDWSEKGRGKSASTPRQSAPVVSRPVQPRKPTKADLQVWAEEGPITVEDIRNPRVRARVLADARAAEDRLTLLLMSKGMHVSQLGNQRKA